jgi:hypothetical protein
MKKLSIGISDFKEVIASKHYYVDKSLFIQKVIDDSKIILLTFPRRFGKTLNMSMLRYFYEKTAEDTSYLFQNLQIWQTGEEYTQQQGQFPVIFLTFKNVKEENWEQTIDKFKTLISLEYEKHYYLQEHLTAQQKIYFAKIADKTAEVADYELSIQELSRFLADYHQTKTVILFDEYDTPLNNAHVKGFYDKAITFIRNLFEGAFKDNSYLEKGVITGIVRIAKEGLFSGLNNISEYSVLSSKFDDKFGFLEEDVKQLLAHYELSDRYEEVKRWYNGYTFGKQEGIYNPWSVLRYVSEHEDGAKPFWVNTSDNALVKKYVFSNEIIRDSMETLIRGGKVRYRLYEQLAFENLSKYEETVWFLLLSAGYLKFSDRERDAEVFFSYNLQVPNQEVMYMYKTHISEWVRDQVSTKDLEALLKNLTEGNIILFEKLLKRFALGVFSFHDTKRPEPEAFYHAFFLGLFVSLESQYEISSNRESGYGRYDICLLPKDTSKLGIVIEIKSPDEFDKEALEVYLQEAVTQLQTKKYATELQKRGIQNILQIAIAVQGKDVLMQVVV